MDTEDHPNQDDPPPIGRKLHWWGIAGTGLWIGLIIVYSVFARPKFAEMQPNEFGDFFAGAFAPLAFLWLVLGFFQQGQELRHSAEALWLQGRELQNSVEQQRELVNVTREQLAFEGEVLKAQREEIERNSQPVLELRQGGSVSSGHTRLVTFRVANVGKSCTAVRVTVEGVDIAYVDILRTGDQLEFYRELPSDDIIPFEAEVKFLNERGIDGLKVFHVSGTRYRYTIRTGP